MDPELPLFDFRNTPTEGMGTSHTQGLHRRKTRTLIPFNDKIPRQEVAPNVQEKLHGDVVRVRLIIGNKWFKAKVEYKVNVRSHEVRSKNGGVYR